MCLNCCCKLKDDDIRIPIHNLYCFECGRYFKTVKELEDGRLLISARVPDTLQFEQWLMSFGAGVEVLKPEKLRRKFKQLSIDLSNIY